MTATADMAAVAATAAGRWDLPPPVLLRAGMNGAFAAGEVVLRVAPDSGRTAAAAGLAVARVLTEAGVRAAAPARDAPLHVGRWTVTAWERLHPVEGEPDWCAVGRMVAAVHGLDPAALPITLPRCADLPWWQFDETLPAVADLVDAAAMAGLRACIERHRGWSERVTDAVVCHGDVHPGNVVTTCDGPVLVDWDLVGLGPPGWDHAMLLRAPRWGLPAHWYERFAAGYGRSLATDAVTVAVAELRLVAATLMRLRAARDDPAAMPEAVRRLAFWRGDLDAPVWTAV